MLILWSAFSLGQGPIRFQNITVNNGLSMGTITGFQKDHKGFLWIATAEGLHRYDGYTFKILKHKENVKNSLSDSYVKSILSYGKKMYVGNNLGQIDILNEETYEIQNINLAEADSNYDNTIVQLIEYQNQIVINTDGGGLWLYNPESRKVRKVIIEDIRSSEIRHMMVDGDHLILLTSNTIVNTNFNKSSILYSGSSEAFTCITKLNGDYVLGSMRGLYRWNKQKETLSRIELPPKKRLINKINTITTQDSSLWVGSSGGLLKITGSNTQLFKNDQLRPYSLVDNKVSNLFIDDEGILWVGTIAGISKYAPQLNKFGLLQYFDFEGASYNNNIYCTYEDRSQNIWIGTLTSGLIKLASDHTISAVYPQISDGGVISRSVRSIYEDSRGKIWIGTRSEGVFQFDPVNKKFQLIANRENGQLKSNVIRDFYEDTKGQIWIGTQFGLTKIDSAGNYAHYRADNRHRNNSIYQIEEDEKTGRLILASFRGGLQLFDPISESFQVLKHDGDDSLSLSNNNLMSMEWIGSDTILIGTYGGGLNICDLRTNTFKSISESDGLVNNAVYGVLYEGQGNCWLSTNNGLVKYNIYSQKFTNFKPVHYLQSTEFNEGAFLKSSKGYYYFGGVSGLNYFKPGEIALNTKAPQLYINEIRGEFTNQSEKEVELSFLNSRLELEFAALYYPNPEGLVYAHQLKGYDNDWITDNNSNAAIYPRLSPGSYTFLVRATDEFGKWETFSKELRIIITPPFWQRWWFILMTLLSISGLIYAIFRYRTREIERTYKLQLVDSELAALRSQMNPHFIFNSLNSIQYFILKKEPREAYTYLSKFASLMRKILQNSRLKYISVADEIEALDLYLEMEKMRMDNNLEYTIEIKNIENPEIINVPTMLIQPFVENSIVHGLLPKEKDRKLEIIISKENEHLLCTVRDNGIGREASRKVNEKRSSKHTSAGMALTEKRLKILSEGKSNFDLSIKDLKNSEGTTGTEVKLAVAIIYQKD